MSEITAPELCRLLAGEGNPPITAAMVSKLVADGMPQIARGKYDGVRCMYWYLGRLRRSVKRRGTENEDGSDSSISDERKRLLRAQADIAEIELAKANGDLLSIADWEAAASDLVAGAKARLMAIPARLAPRVVGEQNQVVVQLAIEKAIHEALEELSKYEHERMPAPGEMRSEGTEDGTDEPEKTDNTPKRRGRPRKGTR